MAESLKIGKHGEVESIISDITIDSSKQKIILECHHFCTLCSYNGKPDNDFIQIHHIDRDPNNNSLDNLTVLCPTCHAKVHIKSSGVPVHIYKEKELKKIRNIHIKNMKILEERARKDVDIVEESSSLDIKNIEKSFKYGENNE